MPLNLPRIVNAILEKYALQPDGDHGVAHWARVLDNGLRLANVTGADIEVVQLFAVFHDCKRVFVRLLLVLHQASLSEKLLQVRNRKMLPINMWQ